MIKASLKETHLESKSKALDLVRYLLRLTHDIPHSPSHKQVIIGFQHLPFLHGDLHILPFCGVCRSGHCDATVAAKTRILKKGSPLKGHFLI